VTVTVEDLYPVLSANALTYTIGQIKCNEQMNKYAQRRVNINLNAI